MKTIFIVTAILIASIAQAQAQSTPAQSVANNIAQKMKDSLSLSSTQQEQLYQINLQLHESKMMKRQQYAGTDSVRVHVQRIENTRDSLYRIVIGEEKYLLYIERKKNLINNN